MFRITVFQPHDYGGSEIEDKLVARFENLTEAWSYVAMTMGHCENTKVLVEREGEDVEASEV